MFKLFLTIFRFYLMCIKFLHIEKYFPEHRSASVSTKNNCLMMNSKASIKENQIESSIYKRIYRNMTLNVLVLKNRYICFLWNYFLSYNAYHSCTCENKNNIHLWTVQPLLFPKKNRCCYDLIKVFWSQLAQVQTKRTNDRFWPVARTSSSHAFWRQEQ